MSPRETFYCVIVTIWAMTAHVFAAGEARQPNFVIIFCDDLGYGDLACFGHPTIATPNLDRMAAEGMKFTQFYAAAPVCTPSRAALMTGRLPLRNGMCSNQRRVLFPDSKGGLPAEEITIAESLQANGYATACVGKWHLGHLPQYLPTSNGFDRYFGIPYSNDMDRVNDAPKGREPFWSPSIRYWNVPLMRGEQIIERPADQATITRRYTEEATNFIREHKDTPFFLYLPHSMPHVPLFRSPEFEGKSRRGLFGDVIEEIDWSVGRVLDTLRELEIDDNTLVFFTSDNGPWLIFDEQGGSAGLLRDGKGSTWEGGMREPTLAWWPGQIKPGSISRDVASTMDIFATIHARAGIDLPVDRVLDSHDLTPVLRGEGPSSREVLFYYRAYDLMAVRKGPWKMHLMTQDAYGPGAREPKKHDPPLLFNLEHDPGERFDVAAQNGEILKSLQADVAAHQAALDPAPSQLEL
ncbi:MAG: sulfatase [Planctomycetaceae bacterium]|nr:sulfatase [Planctomycetales bacterium]MCB9920868.1 sulfatase [Planctomycetaceae bacterium]